MPKVGKPYITPTSAEMRARDRHPLGDTLALVKAYGERLREQGVTRVYIYPVRRGRNGYPTSCLTNDCATVLLASVLGLQLKGPYGKRLMEYIHEASLEGIEVVEINEETTDEAF